MSLNEESQSTWQGQRLEHLRFEYDIKPEDVVIDLGAYRGEWASQIFCRYACKIMLVEPGPWIKGFPIGEVINKAASDHDGVLKFGGAYYYSSSHEDPIHEYECFDVNSLLAKYEEIALVKMNIEGGEYRLMNHIIDAGLHKRVRNFQIQFHCIYNEPYQDWHEEIQKKLSQSHELSWFYPFCWENWERA